MELRLKAESKKKGNYLQAETTEHKILKDIVNWRKQAKARQMFATILSRNSYRRGAKQSKAKQSEWEERTRVRRQF
jgi:hypothetical protein